MRCVGGSDSQLRSTHTDKEPIMRVAQTTSLGSDFESDFDLEFEDEAKQIKTEKFRMARRAQTGYRKRPPRQMNGIHRRRRKKIRL
jgi:hypothetical protein